MSGHFIWNLWIELSARFINFIWNDHEWKILFIIWPFKMGSSAFKTMDGWMFEFFIDAQPQKGI